MFIVFSARIQQKIFTKNDSPSKNTKNFFVTVQQQTIAPANSAHGHFAEHKLKTFPEAEPSLLSLDVCRRPWPYLYWPFRFAFRIENLKLKKAENLFRMIGAMPAVAVRHERRRADKRNKRPSQLYLGGPWLPPSPVASPSPHLDRLPEYYLCGKVSSWFCYVGGFIFVRFELKVGMFSCCRVWLDGNFDLFLNR